MRVDLGLWWKIFVVEGILLAGWCVTEFWYFSIVNITMKRLRLSFSTCQQWWWLVGMQPQAHSFPMKNVIKTGHK